MYYDIALFIPSNVTLGRLKEILDRMDNMYISADYRTFDYQTDGLYFDASYPKLQEKDIEEKIKAIGNGDLIIDWETMTEWEADQ